MTGIAAHTGSKGLAGLPFTKNEAIGPRNSKCIRYIPKESFESVTTIAGALSDCMQVNKRKAPKVAVKTFGVQNSQDHSSMGVSSILPGTPACQKDQPVKAAPARKQAVPTIALFFLFQSR